MNKSRLLFVSGWLIVALIGYLIIHAFGESNTLGNGSLNLNIAPASAQLSIGSKNVGAGNISLAPGKYTVIGRLSGFKTVRQEVTVAPNQSIYVGLVLRSNAAKTKNWYASHTSDQKLSNTIGSNEASYIDKVYLQQNPILKQLPMEMGDGSGGFISISQGVSLTNNGPPAIYVTAPTPYDRQQALVYLRSHGADPASLDVVFYNQASALGVGGNE